MDKKQYTNVGDSILIFGGNKVEHKQEIWLSDEDIRTFGLEKVIENRRLVLKGESQQMPTQQSIKQPITEVTSGKLKDSADAFDPAAITGPDSISVPKSVSELLEKEMDATSAGDNLEDDTDSDIPVEGADVGSESLDDIDVSNKPVDLGSWIAKDKENPIVGAKEITGVEIIEDAQHQVNKIVAGINEEAAKIETKENMPKDIKAFLSLKFLKQKWGILKSTDKNFLLELKKCAADNDTVQKLVDQRLKELEGAK